MCDCTAFELITHSFSFSQLHLSSLFIPLPHNNSTHAASIRYACLSCQSSRAYNHKHRRQATLIIPSHSIPTAKVSPPRSSTTYCYYPREKPVRLLPTEQGFNTSQFQGLPNTHLHHTSNTILNIILTILTKHGSLRTTCGLRIVDADRPGGRR